MGKIPLVVGGSGMYVQVLLDGIFEDCSCDSSLRQRLLEEAHQNGIEKLYENLKQVDPQAAKKINPHDLRRIVRALEVFRTKNEKISALQKKRNGLWGAYDIEIFALTRSRDEVYKRINQRVEAMFDAGLVEEVQKVSRLRLSKTAQALIGIKEVIGYLNDEYDIARAKYLMKLHTRHLAKRQWTWFKRDRRLRWIMIQRGDAPPMIAERIVEQLNHG
jgi:tRNA dimethylallyltransferase